MSEPTASETSSAPDRRSIPPLDEAAVPASAPGPAPGPRGRFLEPPPRSLAFPCAIVGAAGGWLFADAFRIGADASLRWLLAFFTPAVAAALGWFLAGRVPRPAVASVVLAACCTVLAGALNGILVGLFFAPPVGAVVGVFAGLLCAIPFVPAVCGLALIARRVGRARPFSLVDVSDRRAVLVVTMVSVALAVVMPIEPIYSRGLAGVSSAFPLIAAAVISAIFSADLIALHRARAIDARALYLRARDREAHGDEEETEETVDLGVGDGELEEIARTGSAYREHERTTRIVIGSPAAARAALAGNVVADGVALAIALGAFALRSALEVPGTALRGMF